MLPLVKNKYRGRTDFFRRLEKKTLVKGGFLKEIMEKHKFKEDSLPQSGINGHASLHPQFSFIETEGLCASLRMQCGRQLLSKVLMPSDRTT